MRRPAANVVINPNDSQTLVFYNDPVGGVGQQGERLGQDERIPGTTLRSGMWTMSWSITVTTDKNGRVFSRGGWSLLRRGDRGGGGVKLDSTPHYFRWRTAKPRLSSSTTKLCPVFDHKTDRTTERGHLWRDPSFSMTAQHPIGQYTVIPAMSH
jgi:hypothetical protein